MLKYTEVQVTFAEIPTEISLCFSITNCSGLCRECHSPELRRDIGKRLKTNVCQEIGAHPGITCVCFLGEGLRDKEALYEWPQIVESIRRWRPNLKIALYSGRPDIEREMWDLFDYVKVGPFIPECGPLDNPNTNQRLYKINRLTKQREDITHLFWRKYYDKNNS